jgi:anti-sigma regulatory factor (Ser/Thr protein kinase)
MVDATYIRFSANDRSYISILKKELRQQAETAGFDAPKLNDIDIIIAELTSNLHKYATDGELLAGLFYQPDNCYLELISIDHGPSMNNPQQMVADEVSTERMKKTGLGSIKGLSDKFDIYSIKEWGTIILSRVYQSPMQPLIAAALKIDIRQMVISMPGQTVSGDGTYYSADERYLKMLVADGLGHGKDANYAVQEAVIAFKASTADSPSAILKDIHTAILKTRGMVGMVIVFDKVRKTWKLAGVGNITTRMSNFLGTKNLMSYNGIIGHNMPSIMNDQEVALDNFHQVTLCSDGIKPRWETAKYPGINRCDLSIQAAAIYKDYASHTDDMSVVIAKINIL